MKQMLFRIPSKFKLLGTEWKVKIDKEVLSAGGTECFGLVNLRTKTIKLSKGWKDIKSVLFHELAHILDHLTGIGKEKSSDEVFCDISSLFWNQVFEQVLPLGTKKEKTNGKRKRSRKA